MDKEKFLDIRFKKRKQLMGYKKQQILQMIKEELNSSNGDAEYNARQIEKAEAYYNIGKNFYTLGNVEEAEKYRNMALEFGGSLGWSENELPPYGSKLEEVDSVGALGAMGSEGGGTYVTALDQPRKRKLYEVDTVSAGVAPGGGGTYDYPAFMSPPLNGINRKKFNERLAFKDGAVVTIKNGRPVTENMLLEWFGGNQVKGYNAKPFWKGGKFVEIKTKCLTFPYCSEGDSADKPIRLIGETRETSSPCSWDIVKIIAERANKAPETIAKLIREHYLKLEQQ